MRASRAASRSPRTDPPLLAATAAAASGGRPGGRAGRAMEARVQYRHVCNPISSVHDDPDSIGQRHFGEESGPIRGHQE